MEKIYIPKRRKLNESIESSIKLNDISGRLNDIIQYKPNKIAIRELFINKDEDIFGRYQ